MKISHLLRQRTELLRTARLANLAFADDRLGAFAARIAQARLQGAAQLRPAEPAADRPWPVLSGNTVSRAVLEEHFLEEDLAELADILAFLSEDEQPRGFAFHFEDVESRWLPELREELEKSGVSTDDKASRIEDSNRGAG